MVEFRIQTLLVGVERGDLMKKLTNLIGSYIVAIIAVAFPLITGIGMASDWLEREPVLWIACVGCTLIEVSVLGYALSDSE